MPIDPNVPDRGYEPYEAGWRAPPRCYRRPAATGVMTASRLDADGNAHPLALGFALTAIWCVAALLILQNGWGF
jgi:hypothetical protein